MCKTSPAIIIVIISIFLCATSKLQAQHISESPYAIFGDNSKMLKPNKESQCSIYYIQIQSQNGETYFADFDFTNGIVRLSDTDGRIILQDSISENTKARFTTVDPLASEMPWMSPYAYCFNNPIKFIDPDGQNPIYDTQGNFLGTDDMGLQGFYYVMDKQNFTQGMSNFDAGNYAIRETIPDEIEKKINAHYEGLSNRPDYDGFVTVEEGISWAKSHPNALKNPTPDNMLYINASRLDFGAISVSDFPGAGIKKAQNLFNGINIFESAINPTLLATVYALGRVNMILTDRDRGIVKIVNDDATYYDWNVGGGFMRNAFIRINNTIYGIDPKIHGFKTFYYGVGKLRK